MEPKGCLSHRAKHFICRWDLLELSGNTQPISHHKHMQHLHGGGPRSGAYQKHTHMGMHTQLHIGGYTGR